VNLYYFYAEKNQKINYFSFHDQSGNTPLTLSYKKGYINIFKYLVQYFDINKSDYSGNTCLDYAINKKDTDMVKYLIKNGTNINISYLHKAICKNYELFDLFLENELINFKNDIYNKKIIKKLSFIL